MSIVRRTFICLMVVSSMLGGSIAAAETYAPSNQWSDTLMQWARENGIIDGYSDGSYFSLDPLFDDTPIKNRNKTYGFAFFFEEETLKVEYTMSFWLPVISGDDS